MTSAWRSHLAEARARSQAQALTALLNRAANRGSLDERDRTAIKTLAEALAPPSAGVWDPQGKLAPQLHKIVDHFTALDSLQAARDRSKAEAATSLAKAQEVLDNALTEEERGHYQVSLVATTPVLVDVVTDVDKLHFSLAYAWGVAELGLGTETHEPYQRGPSQSTAINSIVVKWYPAVVDKGQEDPYAERPWAHWSFFAGWALGPAPEYRGQPQDGVFGSSVKVAGLSYDVNKYFSIHGGALFFRQPPVNPTASATTTHEEYRWAPYIALGLDGDVFNFIKGQIPK
jgi:hypothetical protein